MYKRHDVWDVGKLSSSNSGSYAGQSSGDKGVGYAGHSSKSSEQDYHKNEMYGANKPEENKVTELYKSVEQADNEKKKEDDEKERTIVDTVEQEEKYQKKEDEEQDEFKTISKGLQGNNVADDNENKGIKKKNNKNIEEAIKDAIKEEKEIVHVD